MSVPQELPFSQELEDETLQLGHDEQEYIDAGIQIQRSDGTQMEFYLEGGRIAHKCADWVVDFFIQNGRKPSKRELPRF